MKIIRMTQTLYLHMLYTIYIFLYHKLSVFRSAAHWPVMPMAWPHPNLVAQVKASTSKVLHFSPDTVPLGSFCFQNINNILD